MLTGKNLEYSVGNRDVFSDVSVSISKGDKIGLIGPNGAGKTTLLHILNGTLTPTSGEIHSNNLEVGLLPQDLRDRHDQSVYDVIEDVTGVKEVRMAYGAAELDYTNDPEDQQKLQTLVDASERLGFFGVDQFEGTLMQALQRTGLEDDLADKAVGTLSGGQRTRVALAAVLAARHDVILLDEPTNNLDMEGIAILEAFINTSPAAFLMVSHDRRFLRQATNRIIELMGGDKGVNNYQLGYDEYVEARVAAYLTERRRYEEHELAVKSLAASARQARVRANSAEGGGNKRRDSDKLTANYRSARASGHLAGQARSLASREEQLQSDAPDKPQEPVTLDFMFDGAELDKRSLLRVERLTVSYPNDETIFGPYDLTLQGGDRVAVTGANGSGKSTLIRAIMDELPTVSGRKAIGSGATIAYIDQSQSLPHADRSPLDNLLALVPGMDRADAINMLIKFNIHKDTITSTRAADLSGGERAKILLASIAAKGANLLILDEPTNNLDIPTIEGLQTALASYKGAILVVSHDREFLDGIGATSTLRL